MQSDVGPELTQVARTVHRTWGGTRTGGGGRQAHDNACLIDSARAGPIPAAVARASVGAARTPSTLPNAVSSAVRRLGPTPGMSSRALLRVAAFLRRRWYVMARRRDSSADATDVAADGQTAQARCGLDKLVGQPVRGGSADVDNNRGKGWHGALREHRPPTRPVFHDRRVLTRTRRLFSDRGDGAPLHQIGHPVSRGSVCR